MNDITAIKQLIYQYTRLIDAGDFQGIGDLFSKAELVNGNSVTVGASEIEALYRQSTRLYECGTPRTQHLVNNILVNAQSAESISTSSVFSVLQATDQLPLQTIITGQYLDIFQKDDKQQWEFRRREIIIGLIGNLEHHLLFNLGK